MSDVKLKPCIHKALDGHCYHVVWNTMTFEFKQNILMFLYAFIEHLCSEKHKTAEKT